MLSAEELMSPRWEVIAKYPLMKVMVGDIIIGYSIGLTCSYVVRRDGYLEEFHAVPKHYPHLFRKLNWWEHRSEEDMPKKVICKAIPGDQEVIEVFRWDMKMLFGFVDEKTRTGVDLTCFVPEHGYFPVD